MRLVLFRHGPAEDQDPKRWPDDEERPLTRDGFGETRRAAQGLVRIVGTPEHLITSPAVRAYATAELLRRTLDDPPKLTPWKELAPGAAAAPVLDRVRRSTKLRESAILIGHEPTLGELGGLSLMGEAISLVRLARAGALCLEFSQSVTPGGARLEWLLTRKQLTRLG
jgi:phosphohistidine phosphatase